MSTITGTLSNEKGVATLPKVRTFVHRAIWALPIWTAMLFLGTLTHQPDPQTDFASFAAYVTTSQFLFSHLVNSIGGAAIGSIGVIGLMLYLQNTKAAGKAITGMVLTVAGNTLTSSVFGAAAFAQTAMGHAYLAGEKNALDFYNLVYSAPLFATVLLGLLLFIIGGVSTARAISASGQFPRWIGWVYAITVIGFVLSNFTIPAGQTPMSILLFASAVAVAWTVSRTDTI
ncbi:MAG TPA: hypothetical protein VFQ23_23030 [Anaerolineales bacterium]|nr:hypothetical protein [Anaerolineales bacterium]